MAVRAHLIIKLNRVIFGPYLAHIGLVYIMAIILRWAGSYLAANMAWVGVAADLAWVGADLVPLPDIYAESAVSIVYDKGLAGLGLGVGLWCDLL